MQVDLAADGRAFAAADGAASAEAVAVADGSYVGDELVVRFERGQGLVDVHLRRPAHT